MPLTGVHFLLSYQCTHECDHCFVWAGPRAGGTISSGDCSPVCSIRRRSLGRSTSVYFEGGEPFLFYPLLIEGIRLAKERGFSTGVVTNCYWATAEPDAELWLRPLGELGVADLSVSSDAFHSGEEEDLRPGFAVEAARKLGLDEAVITIDPPTGLHHCRREGPTHRRWVGSLPWPGRGQPHRRPAAPPVDRVRRMPRRGLPRSRAGSTSTATAMCTCARACSWGTF